MIKKLGLYVVGSMLLGCFATVHAKVITIDSNDGDSFTEYYDPDRNYVPDGLNYISIDSVLRDRLEPGDTIIINSNEYFHLSLHITGSISIRAGENFSPTLGNFDSNYDGTSLYDGLSNTLPNGYYSDNQSLKFISEDGTNQSPNYEINIDGVTIPEIEFRGLKVLDLANQYSLNISNSTIGWIDFSVLGQDNTETTFNVSNSTFGDIKIEAGVQSANTNEKTSIIMEDSTVTDSIYVVHTGNPAEIKLTGMTLSDTTLIAQGFSMNTTIENSIANGDTSLDGGLGSIFINRSKFFGHLSLYEYFDSTESAKISNSFFIGTEENSNRCLSAVSNIELRNVTMARCNTAIKGRENGDNGQTFNHSFENVLFINNQSIYDPNAQSLNYADNFSYSLFDRLPNNEFSLFNGINGNVVGSANVDENFNLLEGSLGVDIGNNNDSASGSVDFNGNARIQDGNGDGVATIDIGATELAGLEPVDPEGSDLLVDVADAIADIADSAENLNAFNNLYIGIAENYLNYAQRNLYWNDDNTLNDTYGGYAMLYTGTAVANLNLTANARGTDPAVKAALIEQSNRLVESMRLQAANKVDEANASNGSSFYLRLANTYLERGDNQRLNSAYPNQSRAVTYYRYAWTYAKLALR